MSDQGAWFDIPELETVEAWDGKKSAGPDPGDYVLRIDEIEQRTTSGKGLAALNVKFIIEANADGSPTPMEGKWAYNQYVLDPRSPKGLGRTKMLLEALGVSGRFGSDALVGKRVVATIYKTNETKMNPTTGLDEERTYTNVNGERPYKVFEKKANKR